MAGTATSSASKEPAGNPAVAIRWKVKSVPGSGVGDDQEGLRFGAQPEVGLG